MLMILIRSPRDMYCLAAGNENARNLWALPSDTRPRNSGKKLHICSSEQHRYHKQNPIGQREDKYLICPAVCFLIASSWFIYRCSSFQLKVETSPSLNARWGIDICLNFPRDCLRVVKMRRIIHKFIDMALSISLIHSSEFKQSSTFTS